jgi:hypothetical protein
MSAVTGPQPTNGARLFAARLRLYVALARALRGFDADARYTAGALVAVSVGVAIVAGIGWALIVTGLLMSLLSPLGEALRKFIRGR